MIGLSKPCSLTCSRGVVHQRLPDMGGGLAYNVDSVLPGEIEGCEDTIAPLDTEYFH